MFVIRTALLCGRGDFLQWWHELTPYEFDCLLAFNHIESFGDERADAREQFMSAALLNAMRFGGEPVKPSELAYLEPPPQAPASPQQAADMFKAAMGGR